VYGEEIAAEPSQFLNEMPIEMIEDLSHGSSWLSFAKSSGVQTNKYAAAALRGQTETPIPKNVYTGKTYNNSDAIAEFFRKRGSEPPRRQDAESEPKKKPSGYEKLKAASSQGKKPESANYDSPQSFVPGAHVQHAKYGRGLVLRREGSGDNVKLTISFPGFGQKKLIEKYANLERA
jgi:DNA helicase-2/ATP-dependent DNA helicase PcrA